MSRYPPVEFENPQNLRGIWFDSPTTRKSVPVSAGSDYEANYDCDPFVADLPYDIDAPEYYWQQWTSTLDADNKWKAFIPKWKAFIRQAGALSSAAVMWSYHRSGNRCGPSDDDLAAHGTPFRSAPFDTPNTAAEILRLVGNPPPEAFFISMLAYGAGIAALYRVNRRDRYQDAALAVGITTAFGAGSILGEDARSIFLRILPFSVLAILALSGLAHQLARRICLQIKANMEREKLLPRKLDIQDC